MYPNVNTPRRRPDLLGRASNPLRGDPLVTPIAAAPLGSAAWILDLQSPSGTGLAYSQKIRPHQALERAECLHCSERSLQTSGAFPTQLLIHLLPRLKTASVSVKLSALLSCS